MLLPTDGGVGGRVGRTFGWEGQLGAPQGVKGGKLGMSVRERKWSAVNS